MKNHRDVLRLENRKKKKTKTVTHVFLFLFYTYLSRFIPSSFKGHPFQTYFKSVGDNIGERERVTDARDHSCRRASYLKAQNPQTGFSFDGGSALAVR